MANVTGFDPSKRNVYPFGLSAVRRELSRCAPTIASVKTPWFESLGRAKANPGKAGT
jgi:hypothetical protein